MISRWISPDQYLSKYIDGEVGGVYVPSNLGLSSYTRNNPVVLTDPDGNFTQVIGAGILLLGGIVLLAITHQATTMNHPVPGLKPPQIFPNINKPITKSEPKPLPLPLPIKTPDPNQIPKERKNDKTNGSYTIEFENAKGEENRYHGKGSVKRMLVSTAFQSLVHWTKPKSLDWTPAPNEREAFKDEYMRMQTDATKEYPEGYRNPINFNIKQSPGKKYCVQDGGC